MATIDQIDDLYRFAKEMPADERDALSVDELFLNWRARHEEDVVAIQEALDSYNRGERGRSVEEFLAEFREKRLAAGDVMRTSD